MEYKSFRHACANSNNNEIEYFIANKMVSQYEIANEFRKACLMNKINLAVFLHTFLPDHMDKLIKNMFEESCIRGNLDIVKYLTNFKGSGINNNVDILVKCCDNKNEKTIRWLLYNKEITEQHISKLLEIFKNKDSEKYEWLKNLFEH
jgi:hypothetical protein